MSDKQLAAMSEKVIPENSVRVFYSKDCMKYGVEVFDHGTSTSELGWRQLDPHPEQPKRSAYTPYKKVAERWRNEFITYGKRVER